MQAEERLKLTQNEDGNLSAIITSGPHKEAAEKITIISQRMNKLVEEAETAGCEGNVEQAQGKCENLSERGGLNP